MHNFRIKNIIVVRPEESIKIVVKEIQSSVMQKGREANIIEMPIISSRQLEISDKEKKIFDDFLNTDNNQKLINSDRLLLFTSARAVQYFFLVYKKEIADSVHIVCLGQKTLQKVEECAKKHSIHTQLLVRAPVSYRDEIFPWINKEFRRNLEILFPCSELAPHSEFSPDLFDDRLVNITQIPIYTMNGCDISEKNAKKVEDIVEKQEQSLTAVLFFSASGIDAWSKHVPSLTLHKTINCVFGESTNKKLKELGYNSSVVGNAKSVKEFVSTIVNTQN